MSEISADDLAVSIRSAAAQAIEEQQGPSLEAAAFLLASCVIGCDPDHIARLLHIDKSLAHTFAYRARRNAIWKAEECQSTEWTKDMGGIAFTMDVLVLTGDMKRVGADQYSMTANGKASVEKLISKAEGRKT